MKCSRCGAEWKESDNTKGALKCPVCGVIQNWEEKYNSLDNALLVVTDYLGDKQIYDAKAIYGCFLDLAPGMKKETKLLNTFLKCDGHIRLLQARTGSPAVFRSAAEKLVIRMKEELLGESLCRTMIAAFSRAIGCELGDDFGGAAFNTKSLEALRFAIKPGTILCDRYSVQGQLELSGSGANLFVCTNQKSLHVARVCEFRADFRQDAVDALMKLNHPCVARLCAIGSFRGFPVDISPYFECGSVQGKTFSQESLVCWIIPDLNNAIHVLHEMGINHRGVKTSNIMRTGDDEHVCLIASKDTIFEIPDEDQNDVFRPTLTGNSGASDYYSLGAVLYELFCGYAFCLDHPIQSRANTNPFPRNMSPRLKALITGLTWTGSSETGQPWGYHEICQWLSGDMPAVPGYDTAEAARIPVYQFSGGSHTDLASLSRALSENWAEGKKQLGHGNLTKYFREWNLTLARKSRAAEEASVREIGKEDVLFWQLLYEIDPNRKDFCWKGNTYDSLPAFGREILDRLWDKDMRIVDPCLEILGQKLLSRYVDRFFGKNSQLKKTVEQIERSFEEESAGGACPLRSIYLMGYLLSEQRVLLLDGIQLCTTGELAAYMRTLLSESYEKFESLCNRLADLDGHLNPQLEAWLIALGKQDALDQWADSMNA